MAKKTPEQKAADALRELGKTLGDAVKRLDALEARLEEFGPYLTGLAESTTASVEVLAARLDEMEGGVAATDPDIAPAEPEAPEGDPRRASEDAEEGEGPDPDACVRCGNTGRVPAGDDREKCAHCGRLVQAA